MEIPIRFKFFDKLKFYQDYLKKDSMLERTKSEYWLYEKAILFWAYSEDHQHLGRPLTLDVFYKNKDMVDKLPKIARKLSNNQDLVSFVRNKIEDEETNKQIIANLNTLEFISTESKDSNGYPEKFNINLRGFILGELLFEVFECPNLVTKNFRIYKSGVLLFYTLFSILLLTTILIFAKSLIDIFVKTFLPGAIVTSVSYVFSTWWATGILFVLIYLVVKRIWNSL